MEQHPVPQQISSYQFHLVGDMTLKQFLQLAGGVVIGLLFYATGLPAFIKWPLILGSVAIGAAMAFIPFEERPLEHWFAAFIRSIYSPTLFSWKKGETEKIFQDEGAQVIDTGPLPVSAIKIPFLANLEETEKTFLTKVSTLFTGPTPTTMAGKPAQPIQPAPIVTAQSAAPAGFAFQPKTVTLQPAMYGTPIRDVSVPGTQTPTVGRARPVFVVEEEGHTNLNPQITPVAKTLTESTISELNKPQFSTDAAPPSPPTIPNTIVGQVMDPEGKIIEAAILEIRDAQGRPVRALKTNKAGHFLIVTPLIEGKYELVIEKDGFTFKTIAFEAKGQIIPPIAVHATGRAVS